MIRIVGFIKHVLLLLLSIPATVTKKLIYITSI